jgi:hypothetical protein
MRWFNCSEMNDFLGHVRGLSVWKYERLLNVNNSQLSALRRELIDALIARGRTKSEAELLLTKFLAAHG